MRARSRRPELRFADVKFQYSFRSAPIVLEAVDEVFRREQALAGLTEVPGATVHQAVRANAPGAVELWPMIEPDEKREARRLGRAVRRDAGDEPAREARAPDRQHHQDAGSTGAMPVGDGDARHPARRATSWCWCASAARCSTRSSAR